MRFQLNYHSKLWPRVKLVIRCTVGFWKLVEETFIYERTLSNCSLLISQWICQLFDKFQFFVDRLRLNWYNFFHSVRIFFPAYKMKNICHGKKLETIKWAEQSFSCVALVCPFTSDPAFNYRTPLSFRYHNCCCCCRCALSPRKFQATWLPCYCCTELTHTIFG